MVWWFWLVLGLILLAIEIFIPGGFYLLFFGLAALATGAMVGFKVVQATWIQWLLFSMLSVISLVLFRGHLLKRIKINHQNHREVNSMVGEAATLIDDLAPGETGKAELRGSVWNVRNASRTKLAKGQRTKVDRVEGLTLWIKSD